MKYENEVKNEISGDNVAAELRLGCGSHSSYHAYA